MESGCAWQHLRAHGVPGYGDTRLSDRHEESSEGFDRFLVFPVSTPQHRVSNSIRNVAARVFASDTEPRTPQQNEFVRGFTYLRR